MSESRRSPRLAPLLIRAEFHYGDQTEVGYLTNLSDGGAFLATEEFVPVGKILTLRMSLPWQLGELGLEAEVVWRSYEAGAKASHHPVGLGLSFSHLRLEDREKLRLYMQKFYNLVRELVGRRA